MFLPAGFGCTPFQCFFSSGGYRYSPNISVILNFFGHIRTDKEIASIVLW